MNTTQRYSFDFFFLNHLVLLSFHLYLPYSRFFASLLLSLIFFCFILFYNKHPAVSGFSNPLFFLLLLTMSSSYLKPTKQLLLGTLSLVLLLLTTPVAADTYSALGCFTDADGSLASRYMYQSSGYCSVNCTSYHYFYIQNVNCYCTNTMPTTEGTCTIQCPGFGEVTCGGAGSYNYWENLVYDGTDASSSSAAGSSTAASSSKLSSSASSSSPTTTDSTKTSETTADSSTLQTVVTQSDSETTVYLTSPNSQTTASSSHTAASSASATGGSDKQNDSSSGVSGGAIAGIIVGVVGAIAIIAVAIFFWRRRRGQNAYTSSRSPNGFTDPFGARAEDKMAFGHTPPDSFMAIDQRLNPVMLGERRLSEGSIADERDYSRKILRVANPDS